MLISERSSMQLIPEFLNSPEALFVGRLILATSLFLCSYAIISKVTPTIFKSSRIVGQGLAILISLYAFQIPFPPSAGPALIPLMWEATGFFNLVILMASLAIVKYVSGFGLMADQFEKRKTWVAVLIATLFVFAIFLPVRVQLLRNQLGEFFPLVYNLAWLLDFSLTILGAIKGVFGAFSEIIEWIVGKGYLAQIIAVFFIIVTIIVIPQVIPYGSIITKLAVIIGILTAAKYRFR